MREFILSIVSGLTTTAIIALSTQTYTNSVEAQIAVAEGDFVNAPEPEIVEQKPSPPLDPQATFNLELDRSGLSIHGDFLHNQITVESRWDPLAESPVGALGLAQFMPRTWGDISKKTEPTCEFYSPTDVSCALRGQQTYMKSLLSRYDGIPELATAAYNAGMGNIDKEIRECEKALGCNPEEWFGHVEEFCIRADWACKQTRAYISRIFGGAE